MSPFFGIVTLAILAG